MTITCDEAAPLIARQADHLLDADERAALAGHLRACVACREAADAQLAVATVLRSRPVSPLPAGFAERVAARLAVESGWLGLADWRVWTFRFAPLAAATAIVVLVLGGGAGPTGFSLASLVETWTAGDSSSGRPAASLFLENDVPGDALLLTVLTEGPDDVVDTTPATREGAR